MVRLLPSVCIWEIDHCPPPECSWVHLDLVTSESIGEYNADRDERFLLESLLQAIGEGCCVLVDVKSPVL